MMLSGWPLNNRDLNCMGARISGFLSLNAYYTIPGWLEWTVKLHWDFPLRIGSVPLASTRPPKLFMVLLYLHITYIDPPLYFKSSADYF